MTYGRPSTQPAKVNRFQPKCICSGSMNRGRVMGDEDAVPAGFKSRNDSKNRWESRDTHEQRNTTLPSGPVRGSAGIVCKRVPAGTEEASALTCSGRCE